MSLSMDRSTLARINREISGLRSKEADELKKEADATRRMNSAFQSASKASSVSTANSYTNTASREQKAIESAQANRVRHSSDVARKTQDASRLQERISQEEERERKSTMAADLKRRKADDKARQDLASANTKLRAEYEARVSNLEAQISAQIEASASATKPFDVSSAEGQSEPWDFFLSHASADKADFADAFVAKAEARGLRVWYDRFSIEWGDSIRQKIDEGLRSAWFGVVLLSPNFFDRPWTNYELDGIIQKDLSGNGRLLPIWHRLTQDDVAARAPSIAGRLALSTASSTTDSIIEELIRVRDRFRAAMQQDVTDKLQQQDGPRGDLEQPDEDPAALSGESESS